MNRDDVTRWAREAGLMGNELAYASWYPEALERLAQAAYDAGAAAENEMCAKVCETHGSMARHAVWMAEECAALIRARNKS